MQVKERGLGTLSEQFSETIDLTICIILTNGPRVLRNLWRDLDHVAAESGLSYEFLVLAKPSDEIDLDPEVEARVVRLMPKAEKASSMNTARGAMRGRWVMIVEAGGQFRADDIRQLIARMREGYDFVNGVRSWRGQPKVNQWQSELFNWCTRKLTGSEVHDLNSTLKIFRRSILNAVPLYGDFFRFLPVLAERKGFRVTGIPLSRRERPQGVTVYGPASYVRRVLDILNLLFITRFNEKPLRFFGGVGLFSAGVGVAMNVGLVFERFAFGEGMADRPIMLLAILLIVMGVQFISIGLIGEMIVYSRTRDFEDVGIEEVIGQ
ncbi:MAG: hypothetical protein Q8R76_11210 [Candidatus Omnitrophota bacterium]|nr:hypothetical protein [Candidatus Omnitrophota bacterium]